MAARRRRPLRAEGVGTGRLLVRRAILDDAPGIAVVQVRSWQQGYRGIVPQAYLDTMSLAERAESWHERLTRGQGTVFVAIRPPRIVGWIGIDPSREDDATAATAELKALYVDPDAWRSGVGRALWEAAQAEMERRRFTSIVVWLFSANHRGHAFYTSIGFDPIPDRHRTLERGGVDLDCDRRRRAITPGFEGG